MEVEPQRSPPQTFTPGSTDGYALEDSSETPTLPPPPPAHSLEALPLLDSAGAGPEAKNFAGPKGELVLPASKGEPIALASGADTDAFSKPVSAQDISHFLKMCGATNMAPAKTPEEKRNNLKAALAAAAKAADASDNLEFFRAGLILIRRLENASSSGAGSEVSKLDIKTQAVLTEIAFSALGSALKFAQDLYKDPLAVIKAFAADVAVRVARDMNSVSFRNDQIDRASATLVFSSDVDPRKQHLRQNKDRTDKIDELNETEKERPKGPAIVIKTQEQKLAETAAKKARLFGGVRALDPKAAEQIPDTTPPNNSAESTAMPFTDPDDEVSPLERARVDALADQNAYEQELEAAEAKSRNARFDDCKAGPQHSAYRQHLPTRLPQGYKLEPGETRVDALKNLRQVQVYDLVEALSSWARAEIQLCLNQHGNISAALLETEPSRLEKRQRDAVERLAKEAEFSQVAKNTIDLALRYLAQALSQIPEMESKAGHTTWREVNLRNPATETRILADEVSVSEEVAAQARAERREADLKRIRDREGWRNNRFTRDEGAKVEPPPES